MTTTYPFRLQLQRNLVDLLKTIIPANGYVTDLSDAAGVPKVYRGRAVFGDNDPLPMVSMMQPPVPNDQIDSQVDNPSSTGDWPLILQGWVIDDHLNPTDPAEILMADVRRCLAKHRKENKYTMLGLGVRTPGMQGSGNHVNEIQIGLGVVRPPDQISIHAYFWLIVTFKIVEQLEKP